jgi:DNA-binding transcriptional regulator YiaG
LGEITKVTAEEKLKALSALMKAIAEAGQITDREIAWRTLERAFEKAKTLMAEPEAQAGFVIGTALALGARRAGASLDAPLGPDELKLIRIASHLTQMDLARLLGVTQSIVHKWEVGQKPIPQRRARQIRQALEGRRAA